jgi:site-specific DNA recombinase
VFRQLIGDRVWVHVERRTGRQRTIVRGHITPHLLRGVQQYGELPATGGDEPSREVEVWLRPPPRLDLLAERVHELVDVQGLSYREAAATLQREGYTVNSGKVWYGYHRYYALRGQPVPERPYNNGRPRRRRR